MRVSLKDIPKEGLELKGDWDPASLDLGDSGLRFSAPIRYRAHVSLMDGVVFVTGDCEEEVGLECGRCLVFFSFPLRVSFRLTLDPQDSPDSGDRPEGRELHPDELDEHHYTGDAINLGPLFREQLLLALPIYPLCRPDCRGLCPKCGLNLNEGSCRCVAEDLPLPMNPFQKALKKKMGL